MGKNAGLEPKCHSRHSSATNSRSLPSIIQTLVCLQGGIKVAQTVISSWLTASKKQHPNRWGDPMRSCTRALVSQERIRTKRLAGNQDAARKITSSRAMTHDKPVSLASVLEAIRVAKSGMTWGVAVPKVPCRRETSSSARAQSLMLGKHLHDPPDSASCSVHACRVSVRKTWRGHN